MAYISRFTGKSIDDYQHTVESLITIFTTPKRTRVYNRAYGSDLPTKQDALATEDFKLELYADIAEGSRLEPRFRLNSTSVNIEAADRGEVELDIYGEHIPSGKFILLEGLKVQ